MLYTLQFIHHDQSCTYIRNMQEIDYKLSHNYMDHHLISPYKIIYIHHYNYMYKIYAAQIDN